jgi:hypothetical protein
MNTVDEINEIDEKISILEIYRGKLVREFLESRDWEITTEDDGMISYAKYNCFYFNDWEALAEEED